MRRVAGVLALVLAVQAGTGARVAVAQALVTQPQRYLLTTDAFDGRALWVQPAGLARRREASIGWSFTGESRDGVMTLEQYGLTFASNGVGLGWQRAELVDDTEISQWVIGYSAGGPRGSLAVARRWVKGRRANDAVWDFGGRYVPSPFLELSAVWRDVGTVVVQSSDTAQSSPDTSYSPTLIPAAALTLFGGRARLAAEAEVLTTDWKRRAARAGLAVVLPFNLGLHLRASFDGDLAFQELAAALTWSGTSVRATGFGQFPDGGGTRHYGAWSSAVKDLEPRRPGWQ